MDTVFGELLSSSKALLSSFLAVIDIGVSGDAIKVPFVRLVLLPASTLPDVSPDPVGRLV